MPPASNDARCDGQAELERRRALIRSWPRNLAREAGVKSEKLRFEKDHAVPALLTSYGVSMRTPIAAIEMEDADGVLHAFRVPAADALALARGLLRGQFYQRLLDHAESSSGTPNEEGSPTDGQKHVPVPRA